MPSIDFNEAGPRVSDVNGAIRHATQDELDKGHVSKLFADEHAKHAAASKAHRDARLRELRDDLASLD